MASYPPSLPHSSQLEARSSKLPTLYLIPSFLDEQSLVPLPAYLLDAVKECSIFFVENERSARRYLKALWKEMVIDDYEWVPIHKAEEQVVSHLKKKAGGRQDDRADQRGRMSRRRGSGPVAG